jgi:hypothetical protein
LQLFGLQATGRSPFAKQQIEITPENIEENLKIWADNVAISLTRANIPESYFGYIANHPGADAIQVFRAKDKPGYLQFSATISLIPRASSRDVKTKQSSGG